jgi:hypothetical protein
MDGARIAVAPLRYGAGVKGKVNLSMAHGQPVVATACAVEGMHLRDGEDVLVADDAEPFAQAVLRAYDDAALWAALVGNGLRNVQAHFSLDAATRRGASTVAADSLSVHCVRRTPRAAVGEFRPVRSLPDPACAPPSTRSCRLQLAGAQTLIADRDPALRKTPLRIGVDGAGALQHLPCDRGRRWRG